MFEQGSKKLEEKNIPFEAFNSIALVWKNNDLKW